MKDTEIFSYSYISYLKHSITVCIKVGWCYVLFWLIVDKWLELDYVQNRYSFVYISVLVTIHTKYKTTVFNEVPSNVIISIFIRIKGWWDKKKVLND